MCSLVVDIPIKVWVLFIAVSPYACRVAVVSASPLLRLLEPCHGSLNTSQQLSLHGTRSGTESDQLIAHKLEIKANIIKDLAIELRDLFANERIQSEHLLELLDGNTVIPEPSIEMLVQETEFVDILIDSYRKSAIAAAYVGQMRNDEENFPFSPSYSTKFTTIESKLYEFMCTLKISITTKGGSVPNVRREVMNTRFNSSTTYAGLHTRDYLVLKDITRIFTILYRNYELLKNGNSGTIISVNNV